MSQANPPPILTHAQPTLSYQHQDVPNHPPGWTNVRMYGLLPEALPGYLRYRVILTTAIRLTLVFPMCAFIFWVLRDRLHDMLTFLIVFGAAISAAVILRVWRVAAQTRREWPRLRIFIADQGLMRTLPGYPNIVILNSNVKKILETSRALLVSSSASSGYILIPSALEHFTDVRAHLAAIKSITPPRFTWLIALWQLAIVSLVSAATVGAFAGGMFTHRLAWEFAALAAVLLLGLWSFVRIIRSPNFRSTQKIFALFSLFLPLVLAAKIVLSHFLLKR